MPFSRSRSIESMTRSATSWLARKAPDCHSMASTSVVLPWSTWATMATLRMSSRSARIQQKLALSPYGGPQPPSGTPTRATSMRPGAPGGLGLARVGLGQRGLGRGQASRCASRRRAGPSAASGSAARSGTSDWQGSTFSMLPGSDVRKWFWAKHEPFERALPGARGQREVDAVVAQDVALHAVLGRGRVVGGGQQDAGAGMAR